MDQTNAKKRKRETANEQEEKETAKDSSDVEIMRTPKSSAQPQATAAERTKRTSTDNTKALASTPKPDTHSIPSSSINRTHLLNDTLKDLFRFLLLKGPDFSSNHQALKKMVESAQTLLEEDPDELIYQTELDEKSLQLKQSEASLDIELDTAANPVVKSLTDFIQTHVEREIKLKLDQAIRSNPSSLQDTKVEKRLEKIKSNQAASVDHICQRIDKIEDTLTALTARIDSSSKSDGKLEQLEKPNQAQADINFTQIQALKTKLKETEHTHKTRLDQLQIKLMNIEVNQAQQRSQPQVIGEKSPETEIKNHNDHNTTIPSHSSIKSNASSKPSSPDITKTPLTGNALRLTLSPQVNTSQPQVRRRSSSQSKTKPNPNTTTNHPRPHPLKIPSRPSVEPDASSPRITSSLPSTDLSDHLIAKYAEAYHVISGRLMKSGWLFEYSKTRFIDWYKQNVFEDINTHLDQAGLTPQRISELMDLLNLLPNLDLNFLSNQPASTTTPLNLGNHAITLPPHPQQSTPIANPIGTSTIPTNFNSLENFSLSYLKDVLGVIQCKAQNLGGRVDRLEIRLANAEKTAVDDHPHIMNLLKRMEFAEVQSSQLMASRVTSEQLLALQAQMEARIMTAQREAKESLKAFWEEMSHQHHTPRSFPLSLPSHPQTPTKKAQKAHQSGISLLEVENHMLDRLLEELGPFLAHPDASTCDDTTSKEEKTRSTAERPRRELEEGETSGDDDAEACTGTIASILTGDRAGDASQSSEPSAKWKKLIGMLSSKYQEQGTQEKDVHGHQIQHKHHYHHHHHHRVRMLLALNESSPIDYLKVEREVQRGDNIESAEQLAFEQHREELEALAQINQTDAIPSSSAQAHPPPSNNPSDPSSS
ncbi:hypothetical protein PCASD_22087 [Puccinia coronata f. sp. avenae]|uniref:Uncharacterized protein n=1 Tax=Puccinia coronata f. sp. avenae TaxID=200324 RepID=A0A2N5SI53_9BASI|nr:hypothetical protein PCASD_22087 [Puccinia coronata f. sp. avenae]